MKSYLLWTAMILSFLLVLVACAPEDGKAPDGMLGSTHHFTTPKGLDCVFVKKGYGGGLSCNWDKFNHERKMDFIKGGY